MTFQSVLFKLCDNELLVKLLLVPTACWNFGYYISYQLDEERPAGISAATYPTYRLLSDEMYHNKNYVNHTDNWFTNVAACLILKNQGIHSDGVCKSNISRFDKNMLLPKTGRAMKLRGFMQQSCCRIDGVSLFANAWMDSKPVHTLSTFISYSVEVTRNWKDADNRHVQLLLNQPSSIKLYNQGMGGTDQFDQRLAYYRTPLKTVKWQPRVFIHFFYCSVVNAYILHRETLKLEAADPMFTLLGFMQRLIYQMIGKQIPTDRPTDAPESSMPTKDGRRAYVTTAFVTSHAENVDKRHYPAFSENRYNCRHCGRKTTLYCTHCNIGLCPRHRDGSNQTCWQIFHDGL